MIFKPICRFNVIATMALIIWFVRLAKGLTYKFGVSINVSWVVRCTMLILVKSTIVNGKFMLCGNTWSVELIDCKQMISSSTVGACTIVVDAWGVSTYCSMDVFKVGSFTYRGTSLGGMPMFIFSLLDHRHSQMLASNNNLVDFAFFYGQMSMNLNFIHTMMQNTFMLKCGK